MDVFDFRDRLVTEYEQFTRSFGQACHEAGVARVTS